LRNQKLQNLRVNSQIQNGVAFTAYETVNIKNHLYPLVTVQTFPVLAVLNVVSRQNF